MKTKTDSCKTKQWGIRVKDHNWTFILSEVFKTREDASKELYKMKWEDVQLGINKTYKLVCRQVSEWKE